MSSRFPYFWLKRSNLVRKVTKTMLKRRCHVRRLLPRGGFQIGNQDSPRVPVSWAATAETIAFFRSALRRGTNLTS